MLKTLDMLIGISVVMLIFSMAVTMLTQFALGVFNSRAKALKDGLSSLLKQLDTSLAASDAEAIAKLLLKHPLVADSCNCFRRAATVIHREELTQLLMHEAAAGAPVDGKAPNPIQNKIHGMVTNGGIPNPSQTLDAIQKTSVALEKSNPDMAHDARMNAAILDQAESTIVAKINAWFDGTIDRVASRFTALARVWSLGIAVILVVVVQLDVFTVINTLSADAAAREAAVNQALTMVSHSPDTQSSNVAANGVQSSRSVTLTDLHLDGLVSDNLIQVPASWSDWQQQWETNAPFNHVAGMLTSVALLSLGAPFWYNILKNLLQLRSMIAGKDDAQRQVRQAQQPSSQSPLIAEGEIGDLTAVG